MSSGKSFLERFRESLLSRAAALAATGLITVAGITTKAYGVMSAAVKQVQENEQRLKQVEGQHTRQLEELERISQKLKKIQSQNSTLYGLAIVSSAGRDESWVAVNLHSPAARFTDGRLLSVTALTREERTIPVKVKGTFERSSAYLIKISRKAAEELELGEQQEVRIRVQSNELDDET